MSHIVTMPQQPLEHAITGMVVCCSSATTCGADSAVIAIGGDVSHSVAANSTFTFAMPIGDALA